MAVKAKKQWLGALTGSFWLFNGNCVPSSEGFVVHPGQLSCASMTFLIHDINNAFIYLSSLELQQLID